MLVRCPSCDSTSHVTAYCRRCSKLVYVECLTLSPQSHNTDQVSIVAGGLRGRTKENTVPQTTQEQLDDEKKVADNASELEAMETQTINRIIEHIGLMREQMKDIGEHLIQRVTASVNKDLKYCLDAEKNVKKVAASIKTLCDAANQIISKMDDIEVIEPECKFPEKLTETFDTAIGLPIPDRGSALGSDFIPGILDTNMLSDTCGKVSVTTDDGSCVEVEASTGRPPQTEVVLGLRQNSTFSVPGGVSVWDGGLCVTTEDMAWVGGVGDISEVMTELWERGDESGEVSKHMVAGLKTDTKSSQRQVVDQHSRGHEAPIGLDFGKLNLVISVGTVVWSVSCCVMISDYRECHIFILFRDNGYRQSAKSVIMGTAMCLFSDSDQ
ncbi:hypothetical protein ScPMuIL_002604 [Solemya velum]